MTSRIVVVGAGIFGVTAALELRRRGHDVVLLDRGGVPHPRASSTDLSKAVRLEYGDDDGLTALAEQALDGWRRWNASWGEALFHEVGCLFLTRDGLRPGSYEKQSLETLRRRGHAPEVLDAAAITRRFGAFAPGLHRAALFDPLDGWVESGRVVERLVRSARDAGVVLGAAPPTAWIDGAGREHALGVDGPPTLAGVTTADGARHPADVVVLAAGAWSPRLLPGLAGALSVVGQPVLHLRPADPERWTPPAFTPWSADISTTGVYGFPLLADGTVKVAHHGAGRAVDPDGPCEVDDAERERLLAVVHAVLPDLARAPVVATRLCLYADTPDGLFLIDRVPGHAGCVVASGGSGHAFKFAPLLGALTADAVEGRSAGAGLRFAWRRAVADPTLGDRSRRID